MNIKQRFILYNIYYILCFIQKSLFPFYFQNHNIYPHWTFGLNPDSGGSQAGIGSTTNPLYPGPGVMKIHLFSSTPVGIKGLVWKWFSGDPIPFSFLREGKMGMIIDSFRKQNSKPCHTMLHIVSCRIENLPVKALVKANWVNIQPKIGYPKIGCVFSKWVKGWALCCFPGGDKINGVEPGSIYLNLCLRVLVW